MVKTEMYPIKQKLTLSELDKRIRYIETLVKILDRLYFVRHRYMGDSVEEACNKVGISKRMGYIWQKRWNRDGYAGLVPRYGGGRPPKLNKEQLEDLRLLLREKKEWKTGEATELIRDRFGVNYSKKQVRIILKSLL